MFAYIVNNKKSYTEIDALIEDFSVLENYKPAIKLLHPGDKLILNDGAFELLCIAQ